MMMCISISPPSLPLPPFPSPSLPSLFLHTANHECDVETEFQCIHSSGAIECLPQTWICDGEVDCYDESGSDEVGCGKLTIYVCPLVS